MGHEPRDIADIGEDGLHLHACPLCEAMCGLEIQVSGGKVARPAFGPTSPTSGVLGTSARRARRWPRCTTIPTGSAGR